jgi:prepilin-type N-terminal cleavage/methylation domain-containing protein
MKIVNKLFQPHLRKSIRQGSWQAGFSFTEVVIVVAIVGIMSSVGVVSINQSRIRKEVESEALKVMAVIRQAQNNALTGKTQNQNGGADFPCNYRVDAGGNRYFLEYIYKQNINSDCATTLDRFNVATQQLSGGVTFVAGSNVNFDVPFGTASGNSQFELIKGNFRHYVCVCASGKVFDQRSECFPPDNPSDCD